MKKIIAILMLAVLVLSVSGCSGENKELDAQVKKYEDKAAKDKKAADKKKEKADKQEPVEDTNTDSENTGDTE